MRKVVKSRYVPYVALAASFSFIVMMFNIPVPDGTTAHSVAGTLIAILLGPWAAVIAVSVALIIQRCSPAMEACWQSEQTASTWRRCCRSSDTGCTER